jgi:hypothetical protein
MGRCGGNWDMANLWAGVECGCGGADVNQIERSRGLNKREAADFNRKTENSRHKN